MEADTQILLGSGLEFDTQCMRPFFCFDVAFTVFHRIKES